MTLRTTDKARAFFEEIGARGYEPLLARADGTVRVDIADSHETEHWIVHIHKGDVTVHRGDAPADVVLHGDKATFDGIASGSANAMTAVLRGEVTVVGDITLAMLFQRLFPGPPPAQAS